jgi:hypothetical protein
VMGKAPDAASLLAVVDGVIDQTTDRFPPPPGVFAKAISEAAVRHRRETPVQNMNRPQWIDEGALVDALAFLEGCTDDIERGYAERQVRAIRQRLEDHGAAAEARRPIYFRRGPNWPSDPKGTVRFIPVAAARNFDDDPFPKGPRNGGAAFMAAIAPFALVVISGAWRVM